jgi:protein-S-isoprenylcysteine O-methyltransferase Ste14
VEVGGLGQRSLLFAAATAFLALISRRSLSNPRCHGFYRFFVFEGALALVLLNLHVWTRNPNDALQAVSYALFYPGIVVGVLGILGLRSVRKAGVRTGTRENFAFENTVQLVTHGIYRYVRHPMYASLLLLAWGAFVKEITPLGVALVLATTGFAIATARVEERENREFFGDTYRSYMRSSKMFIPFFF